MVLLNTVLKEIDLNQDDVVLLSKCLDHNITIEKFLITNNYELSISSKLQINKIIKAKELFYKKFSNTINEFLFENNQVYSTGYPSLDEYLNGGFFSTSFTQIIGKPGSGKSKFCLNLALQVAINHDQVLYIDTDVSFRSDKLFQMIKSIKNLNKNLTFETILSKIHVCILSNLKQLIKILDIFLKNKLIKNQTLSNFSIVIIDSIFTPVVPFLFKTRALQIYDENECQIKLLINLISKIICQNKKIAFVVTNSNCNFFSKLWSNRCDRIIEMSVSNENEIHIFKIKKEHCIKSFKESDNPNTFYHQFSF